MPLETFHTVEVRATKKIIIMSEMDPRMEDRETYRVISHLVRDLDYKGMVYKDAWGGVWRQSEELENISNAMEKWS